jgi:GNAT superfamily N-acetyltransferase
VIRPAGPADLATIATLANAYRAELQRAGRGYHGAPDASWRGWLERRLAAGDVRLALIDGRPVGYAIWDVRRNGEPGLRELYVTDLFVELGDRGHRHGAGLLARALDRARAEGLPRMVVDAGVDERADALLDAFGFAAADGDGRRVLTVR